MDDHAFDILIRDAAGSVSRRRSLTGLGAAGLVAVLAAPCTADANQAAPEQKGRKEKRKKKKNGRQQSAPPPPPDLCAPQVGPCNTLFTTVCAGNPDCLVGAACCSRLGTCDVDGFISCLVLTA